ncbi:EAL domain-containing protein [Neobacillus ginsengisoli]|uniref:EAL domain-containing protein (Putative c-di-GMP-specific phosphodiesterase class I) n=1 Tax=Neobacillus ginsengisoli TaxID=904295 RepID=A0ABT9XU97_9BACI|nr:EAL domain-containing protein [Neobacillus ginsengisoli]MDQ0199132.1 EAL domain-containing protein (putative c-di-GMP-specific phosphodiesterase class I) [Neobacillus ginsengisoli]
MKLNTMISYINYLGYLRSNRDFLFQEFKRKEELKELLQAEKVNTVFQPILSLGDGDTVGFEILNRPQKTELFPTVENFYDYVSKSQNVLMVERFLRNLSLERYSEQIKSSPCHNDQLVFLNIQPQVLADPAYLSGKTLEMLAIHNLSPEKVVLELTEKEAVIDYNLFKKMIEHYRRQGFRIAVDDAGTGYNSLKTLISLKPEFIKIDKSLIRDIEQNPSQQHLVELLLEFAIQSDTVVIAEGIETLAELRFLKKLGVHLGQGYALGKPQPLLKNGQLPLLTNPIVRKNFV